MKYLVLGVSLALAAVTTLPVIGQDQTATIWDGIYTAEQAARGAPVYDANCSMCHGPTPIMSRFEGDTLADAYLFIRNNMPEGAAGTLTSAQYSDITAYLLEVAGAPAGEAELPTLSRSMEGILFTLTNPNADAEDAEDPHAALLDEH